jgi:hypothetical protein
MTQKEIGLIFGVKRETIREIVKNRHWKKEVDQSP